LQVHVKGPNAYNCQKMQRTAPTPVRCYMGHTTSSTHEHRARTEAHRHHLTEFIRLGFVERLRLGTLLRLWTWFRFRRTRYRQRLGLGMLVAPGLSHDLAHQHGARPQRSGDAKSPGRFDKYFPAKNCAPRFLGCKTHFKQTIMLASDLAYATRLQPVGQ